MKKISIIAALILATAAIVSCSPGSGDNPNGKKVLKTVIQVDASEDLIAASDIEITYWNKSGVQVTDTVRETFWKKRIYTDSFPTVIGLPEYRLLVKPDAKFDKDRCDLKLTIGYKNEILTDGALSINIDDIASSKVLDYLEIKEGARNVNRKYIDHNDLKVYLKDGKFEYDHYSLSEQSQEPSK